MTAMQLVLPDGSAHRSPAPTPCRSCFRRIRAAGLGRRRSSRSPARVPSPAASTRDSREESQCKPGFHASADSRVASGAVLVGL